MPASTMQDYPLTIQQIFLQGRRIHADSRVLTFTGEGFRDASFAEVGDRADQLAAALTKLGVKQGERVGTFCWNNQHHLEAYLAIPSMGALLHTLNVRLFPEQLTYVVNHAEDQVVIVDQSLAPLLARVRDQLTTLRHIIVRADASGADISGLGDTLDYEELIAAERPGFQYPELDERTGAAMCYTSGTTGNPKGVMYSHRSTWLHSIAVTGAEGLGITQYDRVLVIVPMFHANAWGTPYAGWWVGADFVFPQQFLQAAPLAKIIEESRPTVSGAVPTILNDILHNASGADLSSLRTVVCGGSAVPRSLIEAYDEHFGVEVLQGWGMTETSPLAAIARVPKGTPEGEVYDWRARTGRVLPGVDLRICADDGAELPWDGVAVGEIEVRGPWITAEYYLEKSDEKFHDGWLRTGDVGSVQPNGFVQITDRAKDVIKSGGEWISSIDLENAIMAHPGVVEAAVVGVPDERWDERPMACVVRAVESKVTATELRDYLGERVAKWWIPERWTFIEEVPKTSVGKFDKKVLRAQYAEDALAVETP